MVSGAGREAVKILMADAYLALGAVEVQADRVVLDGTVYAQAAYRLGDEASVRALTAQTTLNHAVDMDCLLYTSSAKKCYFFARVLYHHGPELCYSCDRN